MAEIPQNTLKKQTLFDPNAKEFVLPTYPKIPPSSNISANVSIPYLPSKVFAAFTLLNTNAKEFIPQMKMNVSASDFVPKSEGIKSPGISKEPGTGAVEVKDPGCKESDSKVSDDKQGVKGIEEIKEDAKSENVPVPSIRIKPSDGDISEIESFNPAVETRLESCLSDEPPAIHENPSFGVLNGSLDTKTETFQGIVNGNHKTPDLEDLGTANNSIKTEVINHDDTTIVQIEEHSDPYGKIVETPQKDTKSVENEENLCITYQESHKTEEKVIVDYKFEEKGILNDKTEENAIVNNKTEEKATVNDPKPLKIEEKVIKNLFEADLTFLSPETTAGRNQYTQEKLNEAFKIFSKYEEFSKIDKKLEDFSRRKVFVYPSAGKNGNSPKKQKLKNKKFSEREIIRIEVFKTADNETWRKKKSAEEEKISEQAKKTTIKITSTIEEEEKIKRKIKVTLNKLSPNNFEKLKLELIGLGKESRSSLHLLVVCIFEKAWSEHKYTQMYAELCKNLKAEFEEYMFEGDVKSDKKINHFRYNLLDVVGNTFHNTSEIPSSSKDPEALASLIKKKTQGNVRFIGELLKVGLISEKIIQNCVETLLSLENASPLALDEDKIEGACILISTAGHCFEKPKLISGTNMIFEYLNQILSINSTISSKLKFAIMVNHI